MDFNFIFAIFTAILILIGLGFSISYDARFNDLQPTEKAVAVLMSISSTLAFGMWIYYNGGIFSRKKPNISAQNVPTPNPMAQQYKPPQYYQ